MKILARRSAAPAGRFAIAHSTRLGIALGVVAVLGLGAAACQSSAKPIPTTIVTSGSPGDYTPSTGTATPEPSGSVQAPAGVLCTSAALEIALTPQNGGAWQTATDKKTAVFTLTNRGKTACDVKAMSQPELVNGDGTILLMGAAAPDSETIFVGSGDSLHTTVSVRNLCGKTTLIAPLRIAFVFPGAGDPIIAMPADVNDLGANPGCQGDPNTTSGAVEMQAWSR